MMAKAASVAPAEPDLPTPAVPPLPQKSLSELAKHLIYVKNSAQLLPRVTVLVMVPLL